MNKNTVKSVRVNDKILKLLERKGWTAQKLFDWAISQKVKVETKIKVKGRLK
jgi:hypothetical protein